MNTKLLPQKFVFLPQGMPKREIYQSDFLFSSYSYLKIFLNIYFPQYSYRGLNYLHSTYGSKMTFPQSSRCPPYLSKGTILITSKLKKGSTSSQFSVHCLMVRLVSWKLKDNKAMPSKFWGKTVSILKFYIQPNYESSMSIKTFSDIHSLKTFIFYVLFLRKLFHKWEKDPNKNLWKIISKRMLRMIWKRRPFPTARWQV